MDVPQVITAIDTGYKKLYRLQCLNDNEIWTRGTDNMMKLYNLRRDLIKTIQIKPGNTSSDIAVTRSFMFTLY